MSNIFDGWPSIIPPKKEPLVSREVLDIIIIVVLMLCIARLGVKYRTIQLENQELTQQIVDKSAAIEFLTDKVTKNADAVDKSSAMYEQCYEELNRVKLVPITEEPEVVI